MKYLPVCLVFILLIVCGGVASRVLFPVSMEEDLAKQSSRILASAGIDTADESFHYYFVSLAGKIPETEGAPLVVKHLGGQVWGAATDESAAPVNPKGPSAKFTALAGKNGAITLKGEVHSNRFKDLLENAALDAIGTRSVDNRIAVNEELPVPVWEDSGPDFLKHFLSFSGVSQLSADRSGVKLEGEVLSREVREKLGEQASKLVVAPAILQNQLSVRVSRHATFRIQGSPAGLKLSGLLPDEATRKNLIAAVQKVLPNKHLKDEIKIAGGVTKPWWLPNAENLIPMFLSETKGEGSIEYWRNRLHVSGVVGNESFKEKLSSVPLGPEKPEGFSMQSDLSIRPQLEPELSVFLNRFGKLVAKGKVGDPEFKDQVLGALLNHNPDSVVLDQIAVSDEVKELGWGDPGSLITEVMFNTDGGSIEMAGAKIEVIGEVDSKLQRESLEKLASRVAGSDSEVVNSVTIREGAVEIATSADQAKAIEDFDFKEVAVYFDSGSSSINASYKDEVEKTAGFIKSLSPGTKLIVGGYTDNRGNRAANERLGVKRAAAVRDRLVSLGVDKDKMIIKTYGEDVTNVSRSNLWKSRRVELSVFRE
ncbi:MAG: OmpA family protein [Verrucomicrobiales bacterium]|nr:OmpA family protein [Verrucomicrobiales bacterium]